VIPAIGAIVLALAATAAAQMLLPLTIGGHRLDVEIADTDLARQTGLMRRESLPDDRGMLFMYPKARRLGFWMKNTLIPLDIAFLADNGAIVQIEAMQPLDESRIESKQAVRFALEVNHGWFAKRGLKAGDRVQGLPAPLKQ
jgi:uncharacterized membrane protein (UPF0127 family)